jgi:hypothetical protein
VQGECKPLNGGEVCTWGRMSGNALVAFGATIPVRAIETAPAEMPAEQAMAWPPVAEASLAFPDAVKAAAGFDALTIYWEPHGHPPGPYLVPHFDFHFYTSTPSDIAAIDCADSIKPSELPAGYELPDVTIPQLGTLIGLCVPKMGMHALPGVDLHAATPFAKTMVVGYYHQRPIFVEPMITRTTLMARQSFALTMPAVSGWPAGTRLPAQFRAAYDSTTQAYQFTFSGFGASGT